MLITAYSPIGISGAPNLEIPIVKELAENYNTIANSILNSFPIKEIVIVPKRITSVSVSLCKEDLVDLADLGVKNPKRLNNPDQGAFPKKIGFEE